MNPVAQPKSEVAKKENSAVAPLRVSGSKPAGYDEVDANEDIKMPRLSILQPTSKLVSADKGKLGDIANSVTEEVFGNSVEFIPLFMFKSRVKFKPGKGLVLLSRDNQTVDFGVDEFEKYVGKSIDDVPHDMDSSKSATQWVGKNPPSFNLVYNYLILLTGDRVNEFPMVLSFMKSGAEAGKELIGKSRLSGEDMYARAYKLSTEKTTNEKGTFAVPHVDFSRRITDEEYAVAQKAFQELYKKRSNIAADLEDEGH